ncbi:MAG TPA: zinc ribbon domain-containing protein [Candidatus Hydrogenedentes bacterium]|nr:zinc ribbon domain-containing protein [Candidatus Hydrogenedentota bacterium]
MSHGVDNKYSGDSSFERIDADAVCEECGTVNPEGTLFCKTCGNNLRDQRTRRMKGEGAREYLDTPAQTSRRVLVGLLTVFALLLLVWAAMPGNVQRLQERLTRSMAEGMYAEGVDASILWKGPISSVLNGLAGELRQKPVTSEDIRRAEGAPASNAYAGRYFLRRGTRPEDLVVGSAVVSETDGRLLFVAMLGDVEIRGIGDLKSSRYPSSRFTGIFVDGRYISAHGFARPLDTGGFLCVGQQDNSDRTHEIMAYRIP